MALFLLANNLTTDDVLDPSREIAYPESVIDLIAGRMGQPPGGFPKPVVERILRDTPAFEGRPGETLPPADFAAAARTLEQKLGRPPHERETISWILYGRVFEEFAAHQETYSDVSVLPTPTFLYGQEPGEEVAVDIEEGKTLIIKFLTVGDPHPDGTRSVFYELNGQPREVTVVDRSRQVEGASRPKADPDDATQIGSPMPGLIVNVAVKPGDVVAAGQKLFTLEAMKMETTVYAEHAGRVEEVLCTTGTQVAAGDLVLRLELEKR
jgi:pyruvate carboxylase